MNSVIRRNRVVLGIMLGCLALVEARAQTGPAPGEYRTIDGSGNNPANPGWGKSHIRLLRDVPADYADGVSSLAGPNRRSPRAISNIVNAQAASIPSPVRASDYLWQRQSSPINL
jgi:hypothetical protein